VHAFNYLNGSVSDPKALIFHANHAAVLSDFK